MEFSLPTIFPALSVQSRLRSTTEYSGKGITIALIDSGFVQHPDLMMPNNRIKLYYDAVENIEQPLPPKKVEHYSWHGTMTACTAAGNGYLSRNKYSSLAFDAEVVLIRTMHDTGDIPTATIVKALEWCLEHHKKYSINIINLSVYADELDHTLEHPVTATIEKLVSNGVVVVAAAGNDSRIPMVPPAVSPSAITVGGLDDKNSINIKDDTLYNSSFGTTIHGNIKPEVIAPAIWLPAPILLNTPTQREAAILCALDALPDDLLPVILPDVIHSTHLPSNIFFAKEVKEIRVMISQRLQQEKVISPYYKHVDGTSFAAPIVCSIVAQMLEVNPYLMPQDIKEQLVMTAQQLPGFPLERQGYGVVQPTLAVEKAVRSRKEVLIRL